jgi:geranylgeranyl diphosphate synthase type II
MENPRQKIGKPIGSDIRKKKSTYPGLFGLEKSKQLAHEAVEEAVAALRSLDERADPLRAIAHFIVQREA